MELIAAVTGGRYMHDTNDLASGFKQTVADLRGSYTLGFYAPEQPDGRWHKLKVKVNRSGMSVRHREGYMAEASPPRPVEWDDAMWQAALSNPLGSSVVPLTAKRGITPAGEVVLSVVADLTSLDFRPVGENLRADLKIGVAERTAGGSAPPHFRVFTATVPAAKWEAARNEGIAFRRQWTPAADTTAIRVVVLDLHTGRYGSLDVPFRK